MARIRDCLENVGRHESFQAGHACDRMPLLSTVVPIVTVKKRNVIKNRIVILTQFANIFIININDIVVENLFDLI